MSKRTTRQTTGTTTRQPTAAQRAEQMAEQMTEMQNKIVNLESLVATVIPDIQKSIQEIQESVKKNQESTPVTPESFKEIQDGFKTTQESIQEIKGLLEPEKIKAAIGPIDMSQASADVTSELNSVIQEARDNFKSDETLTLLKMIGDNVPTFIELLSTMKAVKGLIGDMADAPARVTKELHSTINDMRERFERDETLAIMKKVGDNIPTFLELLSTMEAVKGLIDDMADAPAKVTKELHSTINDMRERFERDETLTILKKVGDNIPTFAELLSLIQPMKGLIDDMSAMPSNVVKELTPTINDLRERFERDETLAVMKMMGDNIPTLAAALKVMPAFQGLVQDLLPAVEKITNELVPTINAMREAFEKDELLDLLLKTGDHIGTFNQLIDFLTEFKRRGHLDFSLDQALDKEMEFLIKGFELCASKTMKELDEVPSKPNMWGLLKLMNSEEVKWGLLLGTTFLRNMHTCMNNAMEEQKERSGAITKK